MIRIDEIYYNTFLPVLQQRPLHGLHWFDPFGSVRYQDLCNMPTIEDNPQAVRYVFWDQEPVRKELFACFADQYTAVYNVPTTLITSETDSDNVVWACDTYNFKSAYYFFHGWAALDWFRGYNRSFLMQPYNERKIKHTFITQSHSSR